MTNLVDKLTDKLKIALGRKITEAQIAEAIKHGPLSKEDFYVNKTDIFYNDEECGGIARRQTKYILATTTDNSEPHRSHTGWYPVKKTISNYDSEGLLVRKYVSTNEPAGPLTGYDQIEYNPHGRFIGKTVRTIK